MSIRIVLAEDHGIVRAGLRALLSFEPDLEVVGEAGDSEEVLRVAEKMQPDVVVMDISMPGRGGIVATQQLMEAYPQLRVLILTFHDDKNVVRAALCAGAAGYILKGGVESELFDAIRTVARGEVYVHQSLIDVLSAIETPAPSPRRQTDEKLTDREAEVLCLIAAGHTNREVADILGLSICTVKSHRASLMEKLNLCTRVELVRYAMENHLLESGES
jgi:two-component system, NarL family, response regulator NreC